mgnify:CR=1 FL=1
MTPLRNKMNNVLASRGTLQSNLCRVCAEALIVKYSESEGV